MRPAPHVAWIAFVVAMLTMASCSGGTTNPPVPQPLTPTIATSGNKSLYILRPVPNTQEYENEIDIYPPPYAITGTPPIALHPLRGVPGCIFTQPGTTESGVASTAASADVLAVDSTGRVAVLGECSFNGTLTAVLAITNPPLTNQSVASIIIPFSAALNLGGALGISSMAFDRHQNLWVAAGLSAGQTTQELIEIPYPQSATSSASTILYPNAGPIGSIAFDARGFMYLGFPATMYLLVPPYGGPFKEINLVGSFTSSTVDPYGTVYSGGTVIGAYPSAAASALPIVPPTPAPGSGASAPAAPPQPLPPPPAPIPSAFTLRPLNNLSQPSASGGLAVDGAGDVLVLIGSTGGDPGALDIFPAPILPNETPTVLACPAITDPLGVFCNNTNTAVTVGP